MCHGNQAEVCSRGVSLILVGFASARINISSNSEMPRWNVDNLMTHIAAAALIVDDYAVDVNDLREDLKLENKE